MSVSTWNARKLYVGDMNLQRTLFSLFQKRVQHCHNQHCHWSTFSLLSSQAEENTSYNSWSTFRNLRATMFQTKNQEVFHSFKVNIQYFLLHWCFTYNFFCFLACSKYFLWIVSGHFYLFPHLSQVQQNSLLASKGLEWRWL